MSIGVADSLTAGVGNVSSLIHESDRALYTAKRGGRDRAVVQDPLAFTVPAE